MAKFGFSACAALPLRNKEDTIGVMIVFSNEAQSFDKDEMAVLNELADDLAFGVVTLRDREDHSIAKMDLKRSEDRVSQMQKLNSIGQLAGGVAHDFNNLFMAIGGVAELALLKLNEESPVIDEISLIREVIERGAALTKQLLYFARHQPNEPRFTRGRMLLGIYSRC